jgi:hypothetical protein
MRATIGSIYRWFIIIRPEPLNRNESGRVGAKNIKINIIMETSVKVIDNLNKQK